MVDLRISDLTSATSVVNGISNGSGVFDKLMNTVNLYLNDQYTTGRLKGTDYANVLLGSMQAVLQHSMQYALQEDLIEAQIADINKGLEVKQAQIADINKGLEVKQAQISNMEREMAEKEANGTVQRDVMGSQKLLYERQKESFDDNKYQKVLEAQFQYNSMIYADAVTEEGKPLNLIDIGTEEKYLHDVYNRLVKNDTITHSAPEV